MAAELEEQTDLAVRLHVALSLCPTDALTHRRSDRVSRREKIQRHIEAEALAPAEFVDRLAEAVDRTLDAWEVQRASVTTFRDQLQERDGSRCGVCGVDFLLSPGEVVSVRECDPFKLAWTDPARNFSPTVDHREPVSKFGTNDLDNLWLLCRFCNEGKGDGAPLLLKHELEFATKFPYGGSGMPPPALVAYSSRLTYRVLAREGFTCVHCEGREHELTIRKERERGLAVLSNLTSVCVGCVT